MHDPERERSLFELWSHEGQKLGLSSYFVGRILPDRAAVTWLW